MVLRAIQVSVRQRVGDKGSSNRLTPASPQLKLLL